MKVLLTQDVFNLGHAGEVKTIADGYGRNYLLPRGMAVLATAGAVKSAERIKGKAIERRARDRADVDAIATVIGGTTVTLHARSGEKGKLFGSITAAHIAAELSKKLGSELDKRKVALREPIREIGSFVVPVRLSTEVIPTVTVNVVPEGTIETVAPVAEAAAAAEAAAVEAPAEPAS